MGKWAIVAIFASVCLASSGEAAVQIPPASSGVINGRTALLVWPVDQKNAPLDLARCAVHMVPYTKPDAEDVFDCGVWFQPTPGKYRYWIEREENTISRYPTIVYYAGGPFEGSSLRILLPVSPAGEVLLKEPRGADLSFRLLHLPDASENPALHRSLDRRRRADKIIPLLMPVGQVMAGLFKDSGDAVAITRPFQVSSGHLVLSDPQPPRDGTDVLVVADRSHIRSLDRAFDAHLILRGSGPDRPPDVLSDTANRVIAIWYGVTGRTATVEFQSAKEFMAPTEIRLTPARVVTLRGTVTSLPKLDVDIRAPSDTPQLTLDIRSGAGLSARSIVHAPALPGVHSFSLLPAEELTVDLAAGKQHFVEHADLRSGADSRVAFELSPLSVEGRVTVGQKPVVASVTFGVARDPVTSVSSDASGHYKAVLWRGGSYVVSVATGQTETYVVPFVDIGHSVSGVDFDVPTNRITVIVTDDGSAAPIAGASVTVKNMSGDKGEFQQVQSTQTDAKGSTVLPPLKNGVALIRAVADGYQTSDPVKLVISSELNAKTVEVRLHRSSAELLISVLDALRQPAAGAELLMIAGSHDETPLWHGVVADNGEVRVPVLPGRALLLIRRQGSGSVVLSLDDAQPVHEVQLPPEGPLLAIKVRDNAGNAIRHARVGMWFGSLRMTTMALGFLTWAQPAVTDEDGVWLGRGLPCAGTRILAWRIDTNAAVRGAFDGLTKNLPCPWPSVVEVVSAD